MAQQWVKINGRGHGVASIGETVETLCGESWVIPSPQLTMEAPPAELACMPCVRAWAESVVEDEELDEALARGYLPS